MPEMADAGEHHRQSALVGSFDDVVIAHRSARLNDRSDASFRRGNETIGKRKEGIGRNDRTDGQRLFEPCAFAASAAFHAAIRAESTRLIWPAPTPTVAPPFA